MTEKQPDFMVGDIISMPGPHPTLPKELEHKYFRVEAIDERGVKLSRPYVDAGCTVPYRAIPPDLAALRLRHGTTDNRP